MPNSADPIKRLNTFALVTGFSILGSLLIGIAVSRLIYPYDVGYYEAFIWTPSRLIISGANPYGYATQPPFIMAPYGAFYYLIIGLGIKLFGLQLWFGRALSLAATLVCLVCLGRLTWLLTRRWHSVCVAVVAFLATFPIQAWLAVQRPDVPSLALAFTGLVLCFEFDDQKDRITARSFAIILLFTAAFFSKQTTLIPVFIGAARYWQQGKHHRALFVFLGTVLLCLSVMLFLNQTSGSTGYFWQHFTHAQRLPFSYAHALKILVAVLTAPSTLIILGIIVLFFYRYRASIFNRAGLLRSFSKRELRALSSSPRWLAGFYLLIATLQALISSARHGASINYYIEVALIASLVVALAWDRLEATGKLEEWLYAAVIVLLGVTGGLQLVRVARGEHNRWQALPYLREVVETLDRSVPPSSICFSVLPELVTASGREYHFDDWGEYQDGFSPNLAEIFREALESKRYAAIICYLNDARNPLPGYHLAPMKELPPEKFHRVYLYLRDP